MSESNVFLRQAQEYKNYFLQRGYPDHVIEKAIHNSIQTNRSDLLQKQETKMNNRIPCVVTFHPRLRHLSSILRNNFEIVSKSNDHLLKMALPEPPLVAYRRLPTIRSMLVHTNFNQQPKVNRVELNRKCNRPRCKACNHFDEKNTFTNLTTGRQVQISNGGTCTTTNCIYAITCTDCSQVYIGQTGRSIAERLAGHRTDIKYQHMNIETAAHFTTSKHKNYTITILDHNEKWTTQERQYNEDLYMCRLQTLHPGGMNKRHSDFVKEFYSSYN